LEGAIQTHRPAERGSSWPGKLGGFVERKVGQEKKKKRYPVGAYGACLLLYWENTTDRRYKLALEHTPTFCFFPPSDDPNVASPIDVLIPSVPLDSRKNASGKPGRLSSGAKNVGNRGTGVWASSGGLDLCWSKALWVRKGPKRDFKTPRPGQWAATRGGWPTGGDPRGTETNRKIPEKRKGNQTYCPTGRRQEIIASRNRAGRAATKLPDRYGSGIRTRTQLKRRPEKASLSMPGNNLVLRSSSGRKMFSRSNAGLSSRQ